MHHFRREDMQNKLHREFRDLANKPSNNEISNFEKQFENMKSLWFTKLATSMEDHVRMQEQVETSSKRVKELTEQLKVKKDNLEKYIKESKEAKEQARIEIENLKKARTDLIQEKYSNESTLMSKGQTIKEASEKRHQETMTQLQRTIDDLTAEYTSLKGGNQTTEKTLLTNYDNADKQYTEALESYDQDMRDKNKERDETQADLEDQLQQLAQIKEQWAERQEEKRRREDLDEIIKRKEEYHRKQQDTLNKAAQFLQAHYRGMLARREMDRARKGKKGKRRKGK